jgi:hypothetical protein
VRRLRARDDRIVAVEDHHDRAGNEPGALPSIVDELRARSFRARVRAAETIIVWRRPHCSMNAPC